jgi:uncharacterized protein (DUF2384 family)
VLEISKLVKQLKGYTLEEALHWFDTPNSHLNNKTPFDVLLEKKEEEFKRVREALKHADD